MSGDTIVDYSRQGRVNLAFAAMAGAEEPQLPQEDCSEAESENMAAARNREDRAVKVYIHFARTAPEGRMKEVFRALADIEGEHLRLFNAYR